MRRRDAPDRQGPLLAALKATHLGLVGIVWTVCQSSDSIAAGSAQIALGNAALGQHTDEQANPLEQTAASMEQLGATVRHNADDAHQANQFSLGASSAP